MEVNAGILKTFLSVELINVTEVKPENSYHWQPLQNFVTISNHFMVKGKGVRFRGTIKECNNAMQQMVYRVSLLQSESSNPFLLDKNSEQVSFTLIECSSHRRIYG